MHWLLFAVAFLALITTSSAQDANAIKEKFKLIEPERVNLIACLSDVVDSSKAQGITVAEFHATLAKSCIGEREEFQKAFLDRVQPTLKGTDKGDDLSNFITNVLLVPILNEFSGHSPYRYRLKDAGKAIAPTSEDIALKSAKEQYFECLSNVAARSKASGASADDVKKTLDSVCLDKADVVRQSELRLWDTYARPPTNLDAAGKLAIKATKADVVRRYAGTAK